MIDCRYESMIKTIARKIANTKFGRKALASPEKTIIFRNKPGPRVYIGLILIVMSYLIGIPTIALLSFLSLKFGEPLIVAIGTPVVLVLVHIIFGLGIYLAGKNYAKDFLFWVTKRFLEKYVP